MADPGTELIVSIRIEYFAPGTDLFYPCDIFSNPAGFDFLSGHRRKEPDCAVEEISIGKFDTRIFLACHGMSGKKLLRCLTAKRFLRARHHLSFRASNIGEQGSRRQSSSESLEQCGDRSYGRGEHDDI